jgi:hypothetical protein
MKMMKAATPLGTMRREIDYFLYLLSALAHNTAPPTPPENLNWGYLHRFSAYHSLSNMVCYGIDQLESEFQPEPEILKKFQRDQKIALAKEAAQYLTLKQVLKTFEEHQIPCLPLKGCLIKYLYPRPDMRLMADMDILFKDEQTKEVINLMLGLGFTLEHAGGNHDVYVKNPFINIEMHRRLVPVDSPYYEYLQKTWARAYLEEDSLYIYRLSPEDFYIYFLIHLAKHYTKGGTGVRSVLDIWLYQRHFESQMDRKYIEHELEKIKLPEFEKNIRKLAEIWFDKGKSSALYEKMAAYILASGAYGTGKHGIIAFMNENKGNQQSSVGIMKIMYRLNLFFPGLKHMSILYPILHRLPFLLPLTWLLRGLKCLLFKRQRTFQIIRNVHSVTKEDIDRIKDLHEKAGL